MAEVVECSSVWVSVVVGECQKRLEWTGRNCSDGGVVYSDASCRYCALQVLSLFPTSIKWMTAQQTTALLQITLNVIAGSYRAHL